MEKLSIMGRAAAVWLGLMAIESLNGTVREIIFVPWIGRQNARNLSFCIAVVLIMATATYCIRWIGAQGFGQLFFVGFVWAALTFGFEAFVVRPIAGISWESLAADYDPSSGGLMAFGLGFLLLAPILAQSLMAMWRPAMQRK